MKTKVEREKKKNGEKKKKKGKKRRWKKRKSKWEKEFHSCPSLSSYLCTLSEWKWYIIYNKTLHHFGKSIIVRSQRSHLPWLVNIHKQNRVTIYQPFSIFLSISFFYLYDSFRFSSLTLSFCPTLSLSLFLSFSVSFPFFLCLSFVSLSFSLSLLLFFSFCLCLFPLFFFLTFPFFLSFSFPFFSLPFFSFSISGELETL